MNKNILTLAVTVIFSISVAQAATYSVEDSFGTQGSTTDITIGTLNETLSIAGFDTSFGTLTGVNVTVFGQLDSAGTVTNTASVNSRAEANILLAQDWTVSSAVGDYTFAGADLLNPFLSDNSGAGFTVPPAGIFSYSATSGELSAVLSGVSVGDFLTGSDVDFLFSTFALTSISNITDSGTGSFSADFSTASWGKVVVDYTYDTVTSPNPVPEPTSLALLGMGLVAFGLGRRKKSA